MKSARIKGKNVYYFLHSSESFCYKMLSYFKCVTLILYFIALGLKNSILASHNGSSLGRNTLTLGSVQPWSRKNIPGTKGNVMRESYFTKSTKGNGGSSYFTEPLLYRPFKLNIINDSPIINYPNNLDFIEEDVVIKTFANTGRENKLLQPRKSYLSYSPLLNNVVERDDIDIIFDGNMRAGINSIHALNSLPFFESVSPDHDLLNRRFTNFFDSNHKYYSNLGYNTKEDYSIDHSRKGTILMQNNFKDTIIQNPFVPSQELELVNNKKPTATTKINLSLNLEQPSCNSESTFKVSKMNKMTQNHKKIIKNPEILIGSNEKENYLLRYALTRASNKVHSKLTPTTRQKFMEQETDATSKVTILSDNLLPSTSKADQIEITISNQDSGNEKVIIQENNTRVPIISIQNPGSKTSETSREIFLQNTRTTTVENDKSTTKELLNIIKDLVSLKHTQSKEPTSVQNTLHQTLLFDRNTQALQETENDKKEKIILFPATIDLRTRHNKPSDIIDQVNIEINPLPNHEIPQLIEETITTMPGTQTIIVQESSSRKKERIVDLPPITIQEALGNLIGNPPPTIKDTTIDLPPLPERDIIKILTGIINDTPTKETIIITEDNGPDGENILDLPPIKIQTIIDNPYDDVPPIIKETTIDLPPLPESEVIPVLTDMLNDIPQQETTIISETSGPHGENIIDLPPIKIETIIDNPYDDVPPIIKETTIDLPPLPESEVIPVLTDMLNDIPQQATTIISETSGPDGENIIDLPPIKIETIIDNPYDDVPPIIKETTIDLPPLPESEVIPVLTDMLNDIPQQATTIISETSGPDGENIIDLPPIKIQTIIDNPYDDVPPIIKETTIDLPPLPESEVIPVLTDMLNDIPQQETTIISETSGPHGENIIDLPPIKIETIIDNPYDDVPPIIKETTIDLPPLPESEVIPVLTDMLNDIPQQETTIISETSGPHGENIIDLPPIKIETIIDNPYDDVPPIIKETTIDLPPLPESEVIPVLTDMLNDIPQQATTIISETSGPDGENIIDLPPIKIETIIDNPYDDVPPIIKETTIDLPPLPESEVIPVLTDMLNDIPQQETTIISETSGPHGENIIDLPPIKIETIIDNPYDDVPPIIKETTIDLPPLPESEVIPVLTDMLNDIPQQETPIISETSGPHGENIIDLPPIKIETIIDNPYDDVPPIIKETTIDLPPLPESEVIPVLTDMLNDIPQQATTTISETSGPHGENIIDLPPIKMETIIDNPYDDVPPIIKETTIDLPPLPESEVIPVLTDMLNDVPHTQQETTVISVNAGPNAEDFIDLTHLRLQTDIDNVPSDDDAIVPTHEKNHSKQGILKGISSKFGEKRVRFKLDEDLSSKMDESDTGIGLNFSSNKSKKKNKISSLEDAFENDEFEKSEEDNIFLKVEQERNLKSMGKLKLSDSTHEELFQIIGLNGESKSREEANYSSLGKKKAGSSMKKGGASIQRQTNKSTLIDLNDDSSSEEEIITTIITTVDDMDDLLLAELLKGNMDDIEVSTVITEISDELDSSDVLDIPHKFRKESFSINELNNGIETFKKAKDSKFSRKIVGGIPVTSGLSIAGFSGLTNDDEDENFMMMGSSVGSSGGNMKIKNTKTFITDGLSDNDMEEDLELQELMNGFSSLGMNYGGLSGTGSKTTSYSSSSAKTSTKPKVTSSYTYTTKGKSGSADVDDSDRYLQALKSLGLLDHITKSAEDVNVTKKVVSKKGKSKIKTDDIESDDIEEIFKRFGQFETTSTPSIFYS